MFRSTGGAQERWTLRAAGVSRPLRLAVGFVALSYAIGAPLLAVLEHRHGLVSGRLGLPPDVVLLAAVVQLLCAVAILVRRTANVALAALTVMSMAAAAAHLRSGSPLAATLAVACAVLQAWLAIALGAACAVPRP